MKWNDVNLSENPKIQSENPKIQSENPKIHLRQEHDLHFS